MKKINRENQEAREVAGGARNECENRWARERRGTQNEKS